MSLTRQLAEVWRTGSDNLSASDRDSLVQSIADLPAVLLGLEPEEDLLTKDQANYREADPKSKDRCSSCKHYSDHSCDVVEGEIDPDYVSDEFDPRMVTVTITS